MVPRFLRFYSCHEEYCSSFIFEGQSKGRRPILASDEHNIRQIATDKTDLIARVVISQQNETRFVLNARRLLCSIDGGGDNHTLSVSKLNRKRHESLIKRSIYANSNDHVITRRGYHNNETN